VNDASRSRFRKKLARALALSGAILAVEAGGGVLTRSLALLADAGHVLTDVAALSLSYIACRFAERTPSRRHTFGLYRAEILAAFINAQALLLVCAAILIEAYRRLQTPPAIASVPMLAFGAAAFAGNLLSARVLHPHREESLNLRGAYLEVASDALASLAVIVGAAVIAATHRYWIDPALSAAIALFILPRTVSLLRQSAHILLEGAPSEINQDRIRRSLEKVAGVASVHDLHVWSLTSGVHSASVHVTVVPGAEPAAVLRRVEAALRETAGIDHLTVQIEERERAECDTSGHR
jgi:cobalt-zinc-cadmium efflux system protein